MSGSPSTSGGGVSPATLVVTAVASAGAAFVMSKLWSPGALASAAVTPVLVALLKELLSRPADVVTRAVPVRGIVRGTPADAVGSGGDAGMGAASPAAGDGGDFDPLADVHERVSQQGEVAGSSRPAPSPGWRMAVITGLLGFLVAAIIITVPELLAGGSAAGGGRDTTFFGGHASSKRVRTDTTTAPTTPTQTETTPLDQTVTIAPPSTVTVPPAQTTPVPPAATTTVPATTPTTPAAPVAPPASTVPAPPPPG